MNIIEKINHKKNNLTKKLMLLELDHRFTSLVNILKKKEINIEETFLKKQPKTDFDWQEYYASLCLFIDQDVSSVLKLYQAHEHDNLSIYDDSTKEITDKLLAKVAEIQDTITKVTEEYHDEILTNYLTNKYQLIMSSYQENLNDILKRNETSLKNILTDNYQESITLTLYQNCTLVKERCLEELNESLNDFVNYINSLSENKKIIREKEQSITTILDILKDNNLFQEFNLIKANYSQSLTNINSIDIQIGSLQKNYFQELDNFYQLLLQKLEVYQEEYKLTNYFDYLSKTNLYQIEFIKLLEIKTYLEKNTNIKLENLLLSIYYQLIKLELHYNNSTSTLYEKLSNHHKLIIEKLFINDLKEHQTILLEQDNYKEFLTTNFSLELLRKFTKLTIIDNTEDILNQSTASEEHQFEEISCDRTDEYFDSFGEVLLWRNEGNQYYFYIVNKSGNVQEIKIDVLEQFSNYKPIWDVKYSNGIIIYKHSGIKINHSIYGEFRAPYDGKIIEDTSQKSLKSQPYANHLERYGHYSDGLIKVSTYSRCYFVDKEINHVLEIKNKDYVSQNFSDGYLVVIPLKKFGNRYVEYLNHQGEVCYRYRPKLDAQGDFTIRNFDKGLLYLVDEDKIVNNQFEEVLSDYTYCELKPIEIHEICKKYLWCLKSKKDGKTYFYEDGKLIPMTEQEIIDRELVENYSLIKEGNNLRFIKKNTRIVNSILDIIKKQVTGEISLPKVNNNQKKSDEIIYFRAKKLSKSLFDNNVNIINYQNNESKILIKKHY